jgi:hypothetical protein
MPRDGVVWRFEHTIDCRVSAEFAWNFWTNVPNWRLDADVETVEIDGPFAAGARGFTMSKSSGRIEWRIAEVQSGSATIEFPLPGAVGRFVWSFEDKGAGTRITQRCTLEGESAATYLPALSALETGIPAGMRKLCETMESSGGA